MDNQHLYIDIFAGCGGLSLGLHEAGWSGLFALEKSPYAFQTLQHNLIKKRNHFNWVEWLAQKEHDINDIISTHKNDLIKLQGKVTLVVGGPPCQGFSMAGKRIENDIRNDLVMAYVHFIDLVRPKVLLFENVKGFTYSFGKNKKSYADIVKEELDKIGYEVKSKVIDFSNYGIPQRRNRFIMIGKQQGLDIHLKDFYALLDSEKVSFLKEKAINETTSIKEAISDLCQKWGTTISPDSGNFQAGLYGKETSSYQKLMRNGIAIKGQVADSHRFAHHTMDTTLLFETLLKTAPKNKRIDGEARTIYQLKRRGITVLAADNISPTITTTPDDYLHYCEPRILTVREYARLQSFPDWFEIKGKYTTGGVLRTKEVPRYTQLGNAIPPLFGELAGRVLKIMLKEDGNISL